MKILTLTALILLSLTTLSWGEDQNPGRQDRPRRPRPRAVRKYFEQLEEQDPEEMKRLQQLRKTDPEAFRRELRERVFSQKESRPKHRERRHVEMEAYADTIRNADSPEAREKAVQQIREDITKRIDRSLAMREQAIDRMRDKISELEERHEKEKQNRDRLIERQVRKVIEQATAGSTQETP